MMAAPHPDTLSAIVAATRRRVEDAKRSRPAREVEREAAARRPRGEAFCRSLREAPAPRIIAECKRRSPSRGVLRLDYDPADIARRYAAAGAAAISVLTEPSFFDGDLAHLKTVREAVPTPLLRKDFIVDEYQVLEARESGADAVLLIAGALPGRALVDLHAVVEAHGLAAFVEVHEAAELERALAAGASIIGVNSRNLRTLEVDPDGPRSLIGLIPDEIVAVAESGLKEPADVAALASLGYDAFLIGERFMVESDPGAGLRAFTRAGARA
jgi:indole-3-glycerol phosphate synthase